MVGIKLLIPTKLHLRILFDNFLAVVCSACLAYSVRKNELSTLGALCHSGQVEFPYARASLVSSRFRHFSLWYCHDFLLIYSICYGVVPCGTGLFQQSFEDSQSRIARALLALALSKIQILTARRTKSRAILSAKNF